MAHFLRFPLSIPLVARLARAARSMCPARSADLSPFPMLSFSAPSDHSGCSFAAPYLPHHSQRSTRAPVSVFNICFTIWTATVPICNITFVVFWWISYYLINTSSYCFLIKFSLVSHWIMVLNLKLKGSVLPADPTNWNKWQFQRKSLTTHHIRRFNVKRLVSC